MKQQDFMGKAMIFIIMIVFIAYLGYHLYTATGNQIETIDAVSVTAIDKINTTGVFIRDQYPLEWKSMKCLNSLSKMEKRFQTGKM